MRGVLFLVAFIITTQLFAQQSGYKIEINIDGYEEEELYLGYHYGDKQYLQDTVTANAEGTFIFEDGEALDPGIYLVVMAPDNKYFQLIITEKEQQYTVKTNAEDPTRGIELSNAPDNQLFYDYLAFLDEQKPEADKLSKEIEATEDEKKKEKLTEKRSKIDARVKAYQENILNQHPNSMTAAIIRSNLPMENIPEFEGTDEEIQRKRWQYTKEHYFDNLNLADPKLLRTPFLFQRVDYFVHKLQVQHPDSIYQAIREVLTKMEPADETFKFYLIHFLNHYAKSNIVGMDAVYVQIVNDYYATGKAPWTEEEQLNKIIDNAKALEPLLIGKQAPNLKLEDRAGNSVELHDIESEITVLYFWRYDCGHCKKSTPDMKAFYDKYKDKGVKLVAVCAKFTDELPGCWEYVDEKEIGDWMHLIDTYHRSRYMKVYNIKSTPQLYVLDKDKTILSKRIGAEQLEEVIDRIIEQRQQENQEGGSK
jgi:thiol-disulfide isomerase/thioredoxin